MTAPNINLQYNNSIYDRQNTSIVHSGETDSRLTAQFIQWAGYQNLTIWQNTANIVTGTEGIVWQPFLEEDDKITVFISDTQR